MDVIKQHTKKFHESIEFQLDKYMGADNHYVLVKLSNILEDNKVYLTEIDTAISMNEWSYTSIDMSDFLKEYKDKKIYYWTYSVQGSESLFKSHDNVVFKNVSDFSYLTIDEDEKFINIQQFFAKNFSFIEHLSTNKRWTRDFLNHTMTFPKEIKDVNDIKINDGKPDFVCKDVEVDSGQGLYFFNKEDYDDELFVDMYCEQFIDSNLHFNTYHLCGKKRSYDVTNYNNLRYLEIQQYKIHDKRINLPNKWNKKFSSIYESFYHASEEYR